MGKMGAYIETLRELRKCVIDKKTYDDVIWLASQWCRQNYGHVNCDKEINEMMVIIKNSKKISS